MEPLTNRYCQSLNIPIGNDGQLYEHSLLSKELKDAEEWPICSS